MFNKLPIKYNFNRLNYPKKTPFYWDSERVISSLMYLCDQERFANCLHFNFTSKSHCQQRSICENDGECLPDRAFCPNSMMCVCNKCYFGTRCQLTTKGFGLSLGTILWAIKFDNMHRFLIKQLLLK